VPALLLACLTYLGVALPASTLGLLWPSMRLSFGEPVGALGFLLVFGVIASVMASAATGRILSRMRVGPVVALGTLLSALALAAEALALGVRNYRGYPGGRRLRAHWPAGTGGRIRSVRGLQRDAAGVAVSAYWATMFLGRVILGLAAERIGPARVLAGAVAGVPAGADLSAAHPHHSATGRGRRFYRNDTGGEPPGSRVGPRRGRGACRPWAGHRIVRCQDPGPAAAGPRPGDGHPLRALVTDRIFLADGGAARG
jgi:hypothetical protein